MARIWISWVIFSQIFFTWVGKCHGKHECGGKEGGGGGSARRFLGTNRNVFNHLGMDFAKSGIRFQISQNLWHNSSKFTLRNRQRCKSRGIAVKTWKAGGGATKWGDCENDCRVENEGMDWIEATCDNWTMATYAGGNWVRDRDESNQDFGQLDPRRSFIRPPQHCRPHVGT